MRLLGITADNQLTLANYDEVKLPPYAILSHTWGADDEELIFEDVGFEKAAGKVGYAKIMFCGQQAKKDDLEHFWVDTCCIKKSSDAELSEAINSMFRWYSKASKCYVYLSDVSTCRKDGDGQTCSWEDAFRKSRWFTRGWTLQELLAPKVVEFWSRDGQLLGTKESLRGLISSMTSIPPAALSGHSMSHYSTNEKFRWAARRETKKSEDKAYCLLGLFGVFMPPIYGEGDHALTRLRQEIEKLAPLPAHARDSRMSDEHTGRELATYYDDAHEWDGNDVLRPDKDERDRYSRQELLESLSFEQADARQATIKDAQRSTCEWLLQHEVYKTWTDEKRSSQHTEMLWIAGKPGAGKSTIMKFVYAHTKDIKSKKEIVLSFFFNARGGDLEKTAIGMYRSLLCQLLHEAPDLQVVLDKVNLNSIGPRSSATLTWTSNSLQTLLSAAVQGVGSRRLKCFIDALDECNEDDVQDMVLFFEDLIESLSGKDSKLQICFASRHYPAINISHGKRLVLEDQPGHAEDLSRYIKRRLQAGTGTLVNEVRKKVREKANGVFMWVVLVVDILNKEFQRGRIFAVKQRLNEIPTKLSELFKDLLRRDRMHMQELLLCLQWILFARRPLSSKEFFYAMLAGLQSNASPFEVTLEDMNRYVRSSSKGLAEVTTSGEASVVQFIHESIRDFLIKDGGLCELWPDLNGQLASLSHEQLKKCCLDCMTAAPPQHVSHQSSPLMSPCTSTVFTEQALPAENPFLDYASKYVLHHADEAVRDISQQGFMADFPLKRWVQIRNAFNASEKHGNSAGVTLPYVAAQSNLARLLGIVNGANSWLRIPKETWQLPVVVAFANGHQQALQVLLGDNNAVLVDEMSRDPCYGPNAQNQYYLAKSANIVVWSDARGNWGLTKSLMMKFAENAGWKHAKLGRIWQIRNDFKLAAREGATDRLKAVFERRDDLAVIDKNTYSAAAMSAIRSHRWEAVRLLFHGRGLPSSLFDVALQEAVRVKSPGIVGHLLDTGAQHGIVQRNFHGPALSLAVASNLVNVVQLFVDRGFDVNAKGVWRNCPSALHCAAQEGFFDLVRLLLIAGADVNIDNGHDGTALQAACNSGYINIVRLLLEKNANVNKEAGVYGNALQAACNSGCKHIVLLLLERGARVNAQGGWHGNALMAACCIGNTEIVRLLIQWGADVNARGGRHGSALKAAQDRRGIRQLLIDHGAIEQAR